MSVGNHSGYVLCGMTLSLLVGACRRNSDLADYPVQKPPTIEHKKDSLLPNESVSKRFAVKRNKRKKIVDSDSSAFGFKPSADEPVTTRHSDTPAMDGESTAVKRFYLEQSLANSISTPSSSIEPRSVHPDSMTWEQIAGVQQPKEKTPDWKIALGYLRIVATILGLIYIIFFDK